MDTPKILGKDEALNLVRRYKEVIAPRFNSELKVMMFGSYSRGCPHEWSDIDVAVIVPKVQGDWLETSAGLWHDVDRVSLMLEPILLEQGENTPLFREVMRTGIAV
ncbi:MAG: nucleotidyltransferase domain-containing protein [Prevotellaceae bacterium]|nr:nucleotidyltransferase domain-containing protein [Prevotellaceae bacterium]